MTRRENLLKVLNHEMPEWIPVTGHVDPYNQPGRVGLPPALAEAFADVRWHDESTIIFSRYLGLDIMDFYYAPLACQSSIPIEETRNGDELVTRWHTPCGELREVKRHSPDTGMWYTVEHMVKEPEDLPALASLFAGQQFSVDSKGAAALQARSALVGDDGIVMFAMTGTPLGQMIRVHAGVETTAILWAEARPELHALFAVMEENHLRQFRLAAALGGVDALIGMDDTSTTTQSPAMFAECCLDYTNHVADIVHAGGKRYFHHSCGLIRDLLDLYRQTKMDAVHAFNIPPLGNVSIAEGKRRLGPQITIIASVVQMAASLDDREAVAAGIRAMFDEAYPGDNFILGLAADPEKTMAETAFVADECRKYQYSAVNPEGAII